MLHGTCDGLWGFSRVGGFKGLGLQGFRVLRSGV